MTLSDLAASESSAMQTRRTCIDQTGDDAVLTTAELKQWLKSAPARCATPFGRRRRLPPNPPSRHRACGHARSSSPIGDRLTTRHAGPATNRAEHGGFAWPRGLG